VFVTVREFREAGLPLPGPGQEWPGDADSLREILGRVGGKWRASA
jgi:hypothetical protein